MVKTNKKIVILFLVIVVGFHFLYESVSASSSKRIYDKVAAESYIEVDIRHEDKIFITTTNNLDFNPFSTEYTVYYPDRFRLLDVNQELYEDEVRPYGDRFELRTYFQGLDELDVTPKDIHNDKLVITDKKQFASFDELGEQYCDIEDLTKIQIDFDKSQRPVSFSFYEPGDKMVFSYFVRYLTAAEFYARYYFRRMQEPVFLIFYSVQWFFLENWLQGVIAIGFLLLSGFLFIKLMSSILKWIRKRFFSKKFIGFFSKKLRITIFSFVLSYHFIVFVPYGTFILYALLPIWGVIKLVSWLIKKRKLKGKQE